MKVAFIGIGIMGGPMAGHLAKAGHTVTVYNRTRAKVQAWAAQHQGMAADTPAEAAKGADIVFSCVGNDNDVREVTIGSNGAFQAMAKNAIFVDHTTASAAVAQELHAAARKLGIHFLDAPVSGGQSGAEQGILTVMVGGDDEPFARTEPVIRHFARAVMLMGPSGSGQKTKMVNQICVAGVIQGLAEGLAFAQHAGLDAKRAVDVISKGAATSWQMENRGKTMIDDKFDFGFAVDLMRKDLRIAMEEARANGAQLPAIALIDQFYAKLQEQGAGRLDTSSLIKLLRK
ncbi:MAG: NAD(P)-dependent oxidoreductase [Betaproteobacteria bacterium]|jgi:3-hydroxyisobutyrate dehydrogenase|nr:NAD(P)-dependent oxidoreductase [Betaproteobacteria bacterium]MDH4292568.1 NAD(P)-dependent oxidoreductase [Betaproteobacteria bacterium]MDH5341519.1 NAD(P)-dependent oxidoreductase [Betaproteobacteria bacterium]